MSAPRTSDDRGAIRREAILRAALQVFSDYGYRRASLEDIASQAEMSRTALYHHFRSKEQIFIEMIEDLHARTQQQAERAVASEEPLEWRLVAFLEAKLGHIYGLIDASRHGAEVLSSGFELAKQQTTKWLVAYTQLLRSALEQADLAGEISLERIRLNSHQAATMLLLSAGGLQGFPHHHPAPADLTRRHHRLVRMFLGSLGYKVSDDF